MEEKKAMYRDRASFLCTSKQNGAKPTVLFSHIILLQFENGEGPISLPHHLLVVAYNFQSKWAQE